MTGPETPGRAQPGDPALPHPSTRASSPYWSDGVDALHPYVPGEQPSAERVIKLNTNENPYGPSPRALEAIRTAATDDLRLYPDPESRVLKTLVAGPHGLTPEHVFVGNGSDEVLGLAFLALLKRSQPILMPDVTYSFYPVYCDLFRVASRLVPLDERLRLRVADYGAPNGGVVIANPNAPTGLSIGLPEVRQLLEQNPDVPVLVDEAYVAFGGDTAVALVADFPNLLVIRTLSKSHSLAGMRVGFAIGQPRLIEGLERVKGCFNSYPVDRVALAAAAAALADTAYLAVTVNAVVLSRTRLADALGALGFSVLPSHTNFLFACHPAKDAAQLQRALRQRGILVRHFAKPRIDQYLRISVGTDAECDALVTTLREVLPDVPGPRA
ncbi:MAG: histidinol-phosphate transaminase [Vicinamibacterales bacterium]